MATPIAGSPCDCGGTFSAGRRFDTSGRVVAVVVCLDQDGNGCGREFPPFGPCCHRYTSRACADRTYCRHCLNAFWTDDPKARYCSPRCEAIAGTLVLPTERAV